MKLFFVSSNDRSSLHELLLFFFNSSRLHVAQIQWVGETGFMKLFFGKFFGELL